MRVWLWMALACSRPDGGGPGGDGPPGDSDSDTDPGGGPAGADGPTIDALVGINGFIDDPVDQLATFGTLREYHNWDWNDQGSPAYPDNTLQFSLWDGYWDFDAYYASLNEAGTDVFPALQGSVASLGYAMPPVAAGADPEDPASYAAHADYMFQVAARYGSVAVPDDQLKLADGQTRVSGLGLLRYFEDGNEPDDNWSTGDGSYLFEPEAYAAMASADYDGHQGALGPGHGVRAADPDAKMVMAGLAGAGDADWVANITGYWDRVLAWSEAHRGGEFPADVLNVHLYCFGPDPYGTTDPRPGVAPEACGLADALAAVDAWRDTHLPDRELWLTEFGWDTDPGSNLRAPAIGDKSAEIVQGEWLVRAILAVAEAGFDRADLFVSRDGCSAPDCEGHDIQFTTCGVWKEKGDFTPKASYWFLATFRRTLAGMRWDGVAEHDGVRVATFRADDGRAAYVAWSPTSDDTTVAGHVLAVPGATTARAVRLVSGTPDGASDELVVSDGTVTLDVDETPVIVVVDAISG